MEQFIEKNAGGHGCVDGVPSANHGDAHHEIAGFRELSGEPLFFTSDEQHRRPSAPEGPAVQHAGWRRAHQCDLKVSCPVRKVADGTTHQLQRKQGSHARTNRRGIVRIGATADDDDSSHTGRFSGADDGAKVPRRVNRFHCDPQAASRRPHILDGTPLLPDNRAQTLRLPCEREMTVELRREMNAGNTGLPELSCQLLSEWVG